MWAHPTKASPGFGEESPKLIIPLVQNTENERVQTRSNFLNYACLHETNERKLFQTKTRPPEMKDFPQVLSTFLIASFDISRPNGFMGKVKNAGYKSNSVRFFINGKVFKKMLTYLETSKSIIVLMLVAGLIDFTLQFDYSDKKVNQTSTRTMTSTKTLQKIIQWHRKYLRYGQAIVKQ